MLRTRVIPCLLLKNLGLVKTVKFAAPKYVGDPINAVKIFNDKECDELIFLDITATAENKKPNFSLIARIAGEAFMPFSYGGGIRSLEDASEILHMGAEKVALNACAFENPSVITEIATKFGNQSVIAAIDVLKKAKGGHEVYIRNAKKATGLDPVAYAVRLEQLGAGEIFLNSIDNDGLMTGYDLELISRVSEAVKIPVVACGGAGKLHDFKMAVDAGASAVSAGSLFVFIGPHRAVLINYPTAEEMDEVLNVKPRSAASFSS